MKKRFLIGILLLTLCMINPYKVEAKITDCIYTVDYCITRTTGGSGAASGASIKQESTYTLTIHNNNGSPNASVTCKSGACKSGATVSVSNIFGTGSANDFKNDNGEFKCPTLYKCSKCVSKVGDSQGKYYSNQTTAISGHKCSNAVTVSPSERKDDGTGNTSGTTGSTTRKTTVLKGCENPTVLKIIYFVLNMLKIATYLVPVGLIFLGMYDFIKAMITNDNTILKNTIPNFVRRIIGAIVIFLVPTLINFGFGLVENDIHSGYLMCIKNANAGTIKELKNKEVQLNKEEQERIKKEQEEIKKKNEETKNNEQSQMQAGNGSNLGSKLNEIINGAVGKVKNPSVLFVGNSKTHKLSDKKLRIDDIFEEMAKKSGHNVKVVTANKGGATLSTLAKSKKGTITRSKYDYAILQEATDTYESKSYANFLKGVKSVTKLVKDKNSSATVLVRQTWVRRNKRNTSVHTRTYANAETVASKAGVLLIRDGKAFDQSIKTNPKIDMYSDNNHQSAAGAYLSACCIYKTLFQEDVTKLSYNGYLSAATAKKLRKTANEVCG